MKETWRFDIGTGASALHYSFESFTYEGVPYYNRIIPESFSGVAMRVDLENKLFAPNEASFDISNNDSTLAAADIEGLKCCISQLLNGVLNRSWTFIIETAVEYYGKISCTCVDPISSRLQGTFPNTPILEANFPSDEDHDEADNYHIPITLGTAFIPCAPFLFEGSRYYVLNKLPATCTIIKVRSPRSWDFVTEWDNSYQYVQSEKVGKYESVKATTLIIADSDNNGTVDANGVWSKNGKMLSPLINFTGAYSTITRPGSWISKILQFFGVSTNYLNEASFTAVDAALSSVTWGGGFWQTEEKEAILSSLLSQCDCYLSVGTTVSLNLFSTTSIETLTRNKIKELSYSPSPVTKNPSDGGTVKFVWDGEPQDELTGKAIVGLYNAAPTPTNPSNDTFEYKYDYNNVNAQKFAKLYFQKKYDQKEKVNFTTEVEALTTRATIVPGKVITISDTQSNGFQAYGASKSVVITSMIFKRGLEIAVEGTVYNHLEDFGDMTATEITPNTDSGGDFRFLSLTKIVTISGQNVFHYATGETVPSPTSITLTAMLYGGLTTYDWEYWNGSAWTNLSGTQNTNTYTLAYNNTAWAVGATTLRVRCKSGDYYGEITITKISDGADGADGADGSAGVSARSVKLTSTRLAITYNTAGVVFAGQSATVTATAINTAGTVYYEFFKNDVSIKNTTTNTYSYTPPTNYDDLPDKIEVQIREGSSTGTVLARDQITIVGLKAGANGITVILTNDSHTLPTTNAGVVTYTGSGTSIMAWEGTTPLTVDQNYPYGNSTFRVSIASNTDITPGAASGADGSYQRIYGEHSAMTANTASIAYSVVVKNAAGVESTFTKTQTFSKSIQGDNGANGANGIVNIGTPIMNGECYSPAGTGGSQVGWFKSPDLPSFMSMDLLAAGISPGDSISVSVLVKNSEGFSDTLRIATQFYADPIGSNLAPTVTYQTSYNGTTYSRIYKRVVVPATARYLRLGVAANPCSIGNVMYASKGMVYYGDTDAAYIQSIRDASYIEFIFRQGTSTAPARPATSQVDNYEPAGWTDEPQGVSSTYPVEWVCQRKKDAFSIWGDYTTPKVWATYAEDGATGAGVTYRGEWATGIAYVGTDWVRDVVKVGTWYYTCQTNHTSGVWATDLAAGKWVAFSQVFASVATDILLAQDVAITRSLTFSGGASFLNIIGADGLVINAAGGLKVVAGADIQMRGTSVSDSKIVFHTIGSGGSEYLLNFGADYAYNKLCFWPSTYNAGYLRIGFLPSSGTRPFNQVSINAYSQINFDQTDTGNARLTLASGDSTLYASLSNNISAGSYIYLNAPYIRGTNTTDIGHSSTSSYRFRSLYLTGNIGSIASPIGNIYCGAITANGALTGVTTLTMSGALSGATHVTANYLNAALNVLPSADGGASLGSTALRFAYANVNNVRIYNGTNYATINNSFASAGTRATPAGYLTVVVNGATRYIQLYSA